MIHISLLLIFRVICGHFFRNPLFFCLWICANYFPVRVTDESYRQDLIDEGYSAEYCNNLFLAINYKTIGILLILCFVFGCLGALIGKAVVKKHFEKAGIV